VTSEVVSQSKRRRLTPIDSPGPCADCGEPGEWYMVHDHLWCAAGMNPDDGFLCIGCLEGRLGRGLCCDDFTDVMLNDLTDAYNQVLMERGRFSPRLIDRLTTPGQPKSPRRALSRRLAREALQLEDQHPVESVDGLPVIEDKMVGGKRAKRNRPVPGSTGAIKESGQRHGPAPA
jgi:hypothetical protein